jgi:hypothetical protein
MLFFKRNMYLLTFILHELRNMKFDECFINFFYLSSNNHALILSDFPVCCSLQKHMWSIFETSSLNIKQ